MRIRINYNLVILLVLIVAAGISGCGPKKSQTKGNMKKVVTVTTQAVVKTTMKNVISLNGEVRPAREAEVSPKVSGKVSQIYFELGKRVIKGEILFKLDDRDLQLELREAEANLKVTRTSLNSSLVTAETNFNDAERNYQRTKRLYENQIASKQELEEAESQYKLAEDTYQAAKLAEKSGETNARAQLEKAMVSYENAKTQLEYTVARAPISGIIATKDIKVGQYVGASTTVATLVDLSALEVETNVPEANINRLKLGDQVEVTVKSVSEKPFFGKISAIAPAVDGATLNYPVKIRVSNPENRLKSGMFATVELIMNQAEQVLAVPLAAVGEEMGRKYVFTVKNGVAVKKSIKTGLSDNEMIQVTDGLTDNEMVVVKGFDQVTAGAKVKVVNN